MWPALPAREAHGQDARATWRRFHWNFTTIPSAVFEIYHREALTDEEWDKENKAKVQSPRSNEGPKSNQGPKSKVQGPKSGFRPWCPLDEHLMRKHCLRPSDVGLRTLDFGRWTSDVGLIPTTPHFFAHATLLLLPHGQTGKVKVVARIFNCARHSRRPRRFASSPRARGRLNNRSPRLSLAGKPSAYGPTQSGNCIPGEV